MEIEGALDAMNRHLTSFFDCDQIDGGRSALKMNHKIENIGCNL
jgi:hypothetical protein